MKSQSLIGKLRLTADLDSIPFQFRPVSHSRFYDRGMIGTFSFFPCLAVDSNLMILLTGWIFIFMRALISGHALLHKADCDLLTSSCAMMKGR